MTALDVQPAPPQATVPAPRRGASNDRQQAVAIQRKLHETILDKKTPAASVASCAVAWTRVQDAKRVIDGKPLPGNLRPDEKPTKGKRKVSLLPLPEVPPLPHYPAMTENIPKESLSQG